MKDNVHDLELQRDKYLHEAKEAFASLSGVKNVLLPLKLTGSFSDQVAQLVRIVAMKDQALSIVRSNVGFAHKELDFLCSQNTLLTQQFGDYTFLPLRQFHSCLKLIWIK